MVVDPGGCNVVDALGFIVEVPGLGEAGLGMGVCWMGAAALGFGVAGVTADGPVAAEAAWALIAPTSIEPAIAAASIACFCGEYIAYLLANWTVTG